MLANRAITERPDLFAADLPSHGSLDRLRIATRDNGPANIPGYGTVTFEAEYLGLEAMSTREHIRAGTAYPARMFLHGVNGIRVPVSQSLKTVARPAAAGTSGKPVLRRLGSDAGQWASLPWQFGDPGFRPAPRAGRPVNAAGAASRPGRPARPAASAHWPARAPGC